MEITPETTMEAILQAYPSAKVGLFQRYHVGGCEACSYRPGETLEEVRRNFNIKASIEEMVSVIRGSAEVFTSLHISPQDLATALESRAQLSLLDVRTPEEHQRGQLSGSKLVTVDLTFEILDTWPKDAWLVFYSNHGVRSLDKASYFRAYGFPRARSLAGGLTAWRAEVGQEALPKPQG
jgi:rhodanese-related sulfurtransferase